LKLPYCKASWDSPFLFHMTCTCSQTYAVACYWLIYSFGILPWQLLAWVPTCWPEL
jgi:hypothetical protein